MVFKDKASENNLNNLVSSQTNKCVLYYSGQFNRPQLTAIWINTMRCLKKAYILKEMRARLHTSRPTRLALSSPSRLINNNSENDIPIVNNHVEANNQAALREQIG